MPKLRTDAPQARALRSKTTTRRPRAGQMKGMRQADDAGSNHGVVELLDSWRAMHLIERRRPFTRLSAPTTRWKCSCTSRVDDAADAFDQAVRLVVFLAAANDLVQLHAVAGR